MTDDRVGDVGHWSHGDVVLRNEVLGFDPVPRGGQQAEWHGKTWEWLPVYVVEDTAEHLVTYVASGTEFG